MTLARDAYSASTSYFDASIRREIEADLRRFQGLHPVGSKYLSEAYRAKSRLFRPKVRTMVTKHEARAAEAFFATRDVVSIEPQDDNDPTQKASAELHKQLLQYRLTKTIPWFLTVMGAYQDSLAVGLVCSYQSWVYDLKKKKDQPAVRLIPLENVRFDPGADWMDPVNTSPYFIELIPMYVKDVRGRMQQGDDKTGEKKWKNLDDATILTAMKGYSDTIRLQREQGRTDSKEASTAVTAYSLVWVHKNIVEHDGEDYCYYTLGDQQLLSDPVLLQQRYHHGKRPYVIGYSSIETHKNYPGGPNRKAKDLVAEANELANTRIENLKLALNKRYLVGRNRQVDIRSLTRNVAGSATLVNDTEKDVKELEFKDVTASSYKEQEVLNLDFDEATGNFSSASVQSNRKMNETLGGMELVEDDAGQVSAYQLRTFTETWVEPVLRQLILLEQAYETDEVILALAGQKAKLDELGFDTITDDLIEQELILSVSVGMGPTSPEKKINRFLTAMRALKELLMDGTLVGYGLKFQEVCREVFGNLGYKDGSRFFDMDSSDPRVAQLQAEMQKLQQQLEAKFPPELIDAQVRHIDAQIAALEPKNKLANAQAVKTGVDASFSAMQAGEVIAAVPSVAPIADVIMQGAGYQLPQPPGVDPNFPQPNAAPPGAPNSTAAAVAPKGGTPAGATFTGGAPGDTSPNTPAHAGGAGGTIIKPGEAPPGPGHGIETQENDSTGPGMANGGLVGSSNPIVDGEEWDSFRTRSTDQMTPSQRATAETYQRQQNAQQYQPLTGNVVSDFGGGFDTAGKRRRETGIFSRFADGGYVSVLEKGDMSSPAYRAQLERQQALQPVYPEGMLASGLRSIAGVARSAASAFRPAAAGAARIEAPTIGSSIGAGFPKQPLPPPDTATQIDAALGPAIGNMLNAQTQEYPVKVDGVYNAVERAKRGQSLFADGGQIVGPGTGTSDSIPAQTEQGAPLAVSNGEYKIPPQVVAALGKDFFDKLIAQYHQPVAGQDPIYQADAPMDAPLGIETGTIIIPADVVAALGSDFFDQLVALYGSAQ